MILKVARKVIYGACWQQTSLIFLSLFFFFFLKKNPNKQKKTHNNHHSPFVLEHLELSCSDSSTCTINSFKPAGKTLCKALHYERLGITNE